MGRGGSVVGGRQGEGEGTHAARLVVFEVDEGVLPEQRGFVPARLEGGDRSASRSMLIYSWRSAGRTTSSPYESLGSSDSLAPGWSSSPSSLRNLESLNRVVDQLLARLPLRDPTQAHRWFSLSTSQSVFPSASILLLSLSLAFDPSGSYTACEATCRECAVEPWSVLRDEAGSDGREGGGGSLG